jgi:tRNA threonylcarbamoyl adenosine modification protein (Sua5/YciO/YrdC/YwlC family)
MRTLFWSNPETIEYVEKRLHGGGVVLAEGDTVLGLLADVSQKGRAQLDHIKNRSKKPYLILVGDSKKALSFIETDSYKPLQIEKLMHICWPGPVTLIFRAKAGVALYSQSSDGTIALRVPDHAGLLQLLSHFDGLFSTSANNAGAPVPSAIKEVDNAIISAVACVVMNDDSQKAQSHLPSTIIDCTGERLVVVRQGAFDASRLMDLYD